MGVSEAGVACHAFSVQQFACRLEAWPILGTALSDDQMNNAMRRPSIWLSLVRFVFAGFLLGVTFALAISRWFDPLDDLSTIIRVGNVGIVVSILIWLARSAPRTHPNTERCVKDGPQQTPVAFTTRLAHFVGCSSEELQQARPKYRSRMKFWSLMPISQGHGPKPTWLIRHLLERIRDGVHHN